MKKEHYTSSELNMENNPSCNTLSGEVSGNCNKLPSVPTFYISIGKIIFVIAIIFFQLSDLCFAKKDVLPANKDISRPAPVLSNTALIRFKAEVYQMNQATSILKKFSAKVSEQMLQPALSLTFNKKNISNSILSNNISNNEQIIKTEEPLLRTYIIEFEGNETPEEFCSRIKNNPDIEIAEPYYIDKLLYTPNDPFISKQPMLANLKMFDAWDDFQGDTSVVIGISDTGVDQVHPDIKGNIAINYGEIPGNNIDDDNNGYIDDFNGYNFCHFDDDTPWGYTKNDGLNGEHGMQVAGITGATFDNGIGITGVAGKCRIFPIKIMPISASGNDVLYGYQSIIYAAIRGFKVLNCSWGRVKPYSILDQSVIDYAVAKDVALVVGGGNEYHDIATLYPAGYFGVLGVGEVDQNDYITSSTSLGEAIRIMAPGNKNYTTNNDNSYSYASNGTSFAAPVVSGIVAYVRAKYPQLNAIQALEFVRQCTDDILDKNPSKIIPGRVNMKKAATINPFSIPAIKYKSMQTFTTNLLPNDRFVLGDTGKIRFNVKNYLGSANNLKFKISVVEDAYNSARLIDSIFEKSKVNQNEEFSIGDFRFTITYNNERKMFFRVEIEGENNYRDFFLVPFVPTSPGITFSNQLIKFSVGDRGTIGYYGPQDKKQGVGFVLKGFPNNIYNAGLMACENNINVVSSIFGDGIDNSDFSIIKPYSQPNPTISIVSDSNAIKPIGLEIRQEFYIPAGYYDFAKVFVYIKNISGKTLTDVCAGYYFDLDIYEADSNIVQLTPEIIPVQLKGKNSAAEVIEYGHDYYAFAAAVTSHEPGAIAQAAGLSYATTEFFSTEDQIKSLTSGTTWQFSDTSDVSFVVGMHFPGQLDTGSTKSFEMTFGAAPKVSELTEKIGKPLDTLFLVNVDNSIVPLTLEMMIYPQPSANSFNLEIINNRDEAAEFYLSDLMGIKIFSQDIFTRTGTIITSFDITNLPTGMYFACLKTGKGVLSKPLAIVK
ncbi:MAG: type sorting protein [Ignavibacteria bacterium]|nr:type sorting protein [Ignavibacteria bacterium]